jgi:hypothetical protein
MPTQSAAHRSGTAVKRGPAVIKLHLHGRNVHAALAARGWATEAVAADHIYCCSLHPVLCCVWLSVNTPPVATAFGALLDEDQSLDIDLLSRCRMQTLGIH